MRRQPPTLDIQLNVRVSDGDLLDLKAIATHAQATGALLFCSRSDVVRHAIATMAANARATATGLPARG